MTLTHEDIARLKAPLPLEAGHEMRIAETRDPDVAKKKKGYARYLVYTTEDPVCERLTEVDPAWCLRHVNTVETGKTVSVTQELTIKNTTRAGTGSEDVVLETYRGEKNNENAVKSAATDALKRAARLFGVGQYLLNAPQITIWDYDSNASYQQKDEWDKQAFEQFAAWYSSTFNAPKSPAPHIPDRDDSRRIGGTPTKHVETTAKTERQVNKRAQQDAAKVDSDLQTKLLTSTKPFDPATWPDLCSYFIAAGFAKDTFEADRRLRHALGIENAKGSVSEVVARVKDLEPTVGELAQVFNARALGDKDAALTETAATS